MLLKGRLTVAAVMAATLAVACPLAPAARASAVQRAMAEDDPSLLSNPTATLNRFRWLGVDVIRVTIRWQEIAPDPLARQRPRFDATDPGAYPQDTISKFDRIISEAQADGMQVDLMIAGGAPVWATGPGAPANKLYHNWAPRPPDYWAFVRSLATRYSGGYTPPGGSTPLPRVSFWSIWSEPDLGYALAPQGVPGHWRVPNSGRLYRGLLRAGWAALQQTGHGSDTILIGELAPRGIDHFGVFAAMKPLVFLRALYCVDDSYRPLRGQAATLEGCPATDAAAAGFRAQNPALFSASGFGQHMWMRWYSPDHDALVDPDSASLPYADRLASTLDRLQRLYGPPAHIPIYNTEFGYITDPPNISGPYLRPKTAARYLNWAEYLEWRDPHVATFDQYLLRDPLEGYPYHGWSTGLLGAHRGLPKLTYNAWRLPIFMPVDQGRAGQRLEVWGCVRPAKYAWIDTGLPQSAELQFQANGHGFQPFATVTLGDPTNCYFDLRLGFPATGALRLVYTYPATDPWLPGGVTVYSRPVLVRVHR